MSRLRSLTLKARSHWYRVRGILRRLLGREKTTYAWNRIDDYAQIWQAAAAEIGARMSELTRGIWDFEKDGNTTRIHIYRVELDNPVTLTVAGDKPLCYRLMQEHHIPVPEYVAFDLNSIERMEDFMRRHQGMFVVKPARGTSSGLGVTTHLRTVREARRAAALAGAYCRDLLIEQLIPGEVFRLLFIDGELAYASRRTGVRLTGDGQSSLRMLIDRENQRRQTRPEENRGAIVEDLDMQATLGKQGLSLDSVVAQGREVLVKSVDRPLTDTEEIRTVYDENVTDSISPDIVRHARNCCELVRSEYTGVDIITMDGSLPLEESGGVVGEINTTPGLHHHRNLINDEQTPDVATQVLRYLLDRQRQEDARSA